MSRTFFAFLPANLRPDLPLATNTFAARPAANRHLAPALFYNAAHPNAAYFWNETRSLRNSIADWRGRHGRSVSRARYPFAARRGHQDSAQFAGHGSGSPATF